MIQRANNKCIVSTCMDRWDAKDSRTTYFLEHFDEWISQIPDDIYEIVLHLLDRFEYYSQKSLNCSLYELGQMLNSQEAFDDETTVYTHIPSKKGIENSSINCLYNYKGLHGIEKFKMAIDFGTYMEKYEESIDNVVIVDDFCGSGSSLETFIKNYGAQLKGKTIYYLVTYAMDEAVQRLNDIAAEYGVTLHILYVNHGARALDDMGISDNPKETRRLITAFSQRVGIPRDRCLGAYETEALVAFYDNTPNNTIGIFHYDAEKYFSLFPRMKERYRKTKRPVPSVMKEEKKKRNIQNYNASAATGEIDNG